MTAQVTKEYVDRIVTKYSEKLTGELAGFLQSAKCTNCEKDFDSTGDVYETLFGRLRSGFVWKCADCVESQRIRDEAKASIPEFILNLKRKGIERLEIEDAVRVVFGAQ